MLNHVNALQRAGLITMFSYTVKASDNLAKQIARNAKTLNIKWDLQLWWFRIDFRNNFLFQVSSWGGYVFLINLIPLHVLALMCLGRFSARVYVAYSTLYCVGTILSMQISFVGFQPIQSSEHMLVSWLSFILSCAWQLIIYEFDFFFIKFDCSSKCGHIKKIVFENVSNVFLVCNR